MRTNPSTLHGRGDYRPGHTWIRWPLSNMFVRSGIEQSTTLTCEFTLVWMRDHSI